LGKWSRMELDLDLDLDLDLNYGSIQLPSTI
jgi:hypothetical protein